MNSNGTLKRELQQIVLRKGGIMLVIPVLFAMETVPLLFYILIALAVLAVPAAYVWDKVIQPKIEEKRKAEEEAKLAAEEGVAEAGVAEAGVTEGGVAGGEIEEELVAGEEGEMAMPADEGQEGEEPMPEPAAELEVGEPHEGDAEDEDGAPEDMFKIDTGN